jgi:hypothetical protein
MLAVTNWIDTTREIARAITFFATLGFLFQKQANRFAGETSIRLICHGHCFSREVFCTRADETMLV